jgi:hypothetical protein
MTDRSFAGRGGDEINLEVTTFPAFFFSDSYRVVDPLQREGVTLCDRPRQN